MVMCAARCRTNSRYECLMISHVYYNQSHVQIEDWNIGASGNVRRGGLCAYRPQARTSRVHARARLAGRRGKPGGPSLQQPGAFLPPPQGTRGPLRSALKGVRLSGTFPVFPRAGNDRHGDGGRMPTVTVGPQGVRSERRVERREDKRPGPA